ncbi:hypothetical protein FA15DRAFT_704524 [Coprinopsis marcescibilis]|uniref:DUF6533 domain-containing protein n=1 Tax=Coprinopsis marcescibilis TaxID=230819 RepID=A0A5C3KV48_COPMA|nr:hypothetical protein FA15DRAFT_704524 [Coprinopsis marcescibilis]
MQPEDAAIVARRIVLTKASRRGDFARRMLMTRIQYSYTSSLTIVLFDMVLTVGREVKTVWGSRMTVGLGIFLLNRYIPPLILLLDLADPTHSEIDVLGCLPSCTSALCRRLSISFWSLFLLFESVVFFMTAWKICSTYSISRREFTYYRRSRRLIHVLIRDGLIYYLLIICALMVTFFLWLFNPFALYLGIG